MTFKRFKLYSLQTKWSEFFKERSLRGKVITVENKEIGSELTKRSPASLHEQEISHLVYCSNSFQRKASPYLCWLELSSAENNGTCMPKTACDRLHIDNVS